MSSTSIRAQHLGFSFDASVQVLHDVSFHLSPGWTALVGGNGAGKTTLLQLIRGALTPTEGQLKREPANALIVWCPQRVDVLEAEVEQFAEAHDGTARRLHGQLKLEPWTLMRWSTLSPGERKRWQLGAALWREPDVLLLDEPSNHLDAEALALIRAALISFRGVGLIVSHDRELLDAVTSHTLWLDRGALREAPLPYSQARAQWDAEDESARQQQLHTKKKLNAELKSLDARKRAAESASHGRNTRVRMRNKNDSDARTLAANFSAEMAEKAHAAQMRRVEQHAERTREALEQLDVRDDAGRAFYVKYEHPPRRTLVSFDGELRSDDGTPLKDDLHLQINRGEHRWIRGPNGAGKTTLLRRLLEASTLPRERMLVLPQEPEADDLEALRALPPEERGKVLQLVHALGVEPARLLDSANPSPGEARKLRLALGLAQNAWLAILDEPTNHLDLPSIERLEVALRDFPGALVLVTHDTAFGEAVCTSTLVL